MCSHSFNKAVFHDILWILIKKSLFRENQLTDDGIQKGTFTCSYVSNDAHKFTLLYWDFNIFQGQKVLKFLLLAIKKPILLIIFDFCRFWAFGHHFCLLCQQAPVKACFLRNVDWVWSRSSSDLVDHGSIDLINLHKLLYPCHWNLEFKHLTNELREWTKGFFY